MRQLIRSNCKSPMIIPKMYATIFLLQVLNANLAFCSWDVGENKLINVAQRSGCPSDCTGCYFPDYGTGDLCYYPYDFMLTVEQCPDRGGLVCSAVATEEPVDCEWKGWTKWGKCTQGKQIRTRKVKTQASSGGEECVGNDMDTRACEEKCWNWRSKNKCRAVKMKGLCGKTFWQEKCCATCRAGCANIWSKGKCQRLRVHCKRNLNVRRKCQKSCGKC